jgi:LysR family nitrogen assimilation transcriptional regulator
LRQLVEAAAARERVTLHIRTEVDSLSSLLDLVAAGIGSTVLPATAIRDRIADGSLVAAPITTPPLTRSLVLVTPPNRVPSYGAETVIRIIKRQVRELDARYGWSALPVAME